MPLAPSGGAQGISAKQLEKLLGIQVKQYGNDGRMIATWSFRDPAQAQSLEFEPQEVALEPERGLVLKPSGDEDAAASFLELHFATPCRITIQWTPVVANATLAVYAIDGQNSENASACVVNADIPGGDGRCIYMGRIEKGDMKPVGEPARFSTRTGGPCRITCEWKTGAWSLYQGELKEPLVRDPQFPYKSFEFMLGAVGGEVAIRSIEVDGKVVPESVRKLVNAVSAVSRSEAAAAAPQPEAEDDNLEALLKEMDATNSPEYQACAAKVDEGTRKDVDEALRHVEARRYPKAIALLEPRASKSAWTMQFLASAHAAAGDRERAIKLLEEAVALDATVPEFWQALGEAYSDAGVSDKATAAFEKGISASPKWPWVHVAQALHWLDHLRLDRAQKELARAFEKERDSKALAAVAADWKRLDSRPDWKTVFKAERGVYQIESDVSAKACADVGSRLAMFRRFLESAFPIPIKQKDPCRVWIFDSEAGFRVYSERMGAHSAGTVGFYNPLIRTLVLFHKISAAETQDVLFHEAFHQYFHLVAEDPPIWLDEGLAEYYGATTFDSAAKATEGGVQTSRIGDLKLRGKETLIPLRMLMLMPSRAFMDEGAENRYAQSWALVHWFKRGTNPKARETFNRYVAAVLANKPQQACFDETFGALDPGDLDRWQREFLAYIGTL